MNKREHLWHYLVLIFVLGLGFLGFLTFDKDSTSRFLSLFSAILGYIGWGVWHHYIEGRLSWLVISEYLLLGLVVLATASLLVFPL